MFTPSRDMNADYAISSFSMYKNNDAIAKAGKTNPTKGTKIDGRYAAAMKNLLCKKTIGSSPKHNKIAFGVCLICLYF